MKRVRSATAPSGRSFSAPASRQKQWREGAEAGDSYRRRSRVPSLSESSWVWAVTSDLSGWFWGWRRADSESARRPVGLTGKGRVARRRPRTFGVT